MKLEMLMWSLTCITAILSGMNSLDSDQARHFVGPDLGPNCLRRLSADDTSRQRVIPYHACIFL